jgi:hypothetical protein
VPDNEGSEKTRPEAPARLVVVSSREPVVVSSPKSTFKASSYPRGESSIAARVKARRHDTVAESPSIPESIADRVARRRQESAHPVLDTDTGDLLEYRQLLKHPKFATVWNRSAADEFCRLAQGIGGRVKGTDTIKYIHKKDIPPDRLKDVTYIKFVCMVRTEKADPIPIAPEPRWAEI